MKFTIFFFFLVICCVQAKILITEDLIQEIRDRIKLERQEGRTCGDKHYDPQEPLEHCEALDFVALGYVQDRCILKSDFDQTDNQFLPDGSTTDKRVIRWNDNPDVPFTGDDLTIEDRLNLHGLPRDFFGELMQVSNDLNVALVLDKWFEDEATCHALMSDTFSSFGFGVHKCGDAFYWALVTNTIQSEEKGCLKSQVPVFPPAKISLKLTDTGYRLRYIPGVNAKKTKILLKFMKTGEVKTKKVKRKTMSNTMKSMHQASMNAIRNIRSKKRQSDDGIDMEFGRYKFLLYSIGYNGKRAKRTVKFALRRNWELKLL